MTDARYGERHIGNVDILNESGQTIAVGRLNGTKFQGEHGENAWRGQMTAIAPPTAAESLSGEYRLRFPDGTEHPVIIETGSLGDSQIAPGLSIAVTGLGEPPF